MLVFVIIVFVILFFVISSGTNNNTNNNHKSYSFSDERKTVPETQTVKNTPKTQTIKQTIDYDKLPYSDEILIRFYRAISKEHNCKKINRLEKTAVFQSRLNPTELYNTNLQKCSCPDEVLPCKHMLYLADSLGVLENWKRNLPTDRYVNIVKFYINSQYKNDPDGWVHDKFAPQD